MMTHAYLLLVLFIAVQGALTDIKSGCVRNKNLIIVLALWLIIAVSEYFILHLSSVLTFELAINMILAIIVSIVFYLTDIWAPGDCKLYIVISLIFPMRAYVVRKGNIFPSLDFVIYAFTLGYIFLVITTVIHKAAIKMNIKLKFNIRYSLSILANAGIMSFLNILLNTFAPEFFYANQMLCILSSVTLIFLLHKKAYTTGKIIGFLGLIYILAQSILCNMWLSTFVSFTVSLAVASVIEFISSRVRVNTYREISGDEIRPGMILSFASLWAMRKCLDPELPQTTTENRISRITQRQAEAVKTWCKNANSNIVIVEMMPFAQFIAAAVVIEILRFLVLGG